MSVSHYFHPHRYVSLWSYGPLDGGLPHKAYGRAKDADKFLMSQQYTRNTLVTSSFCDMRLSIACAATDAEFQNRIILHDNTLNISSVAQQPHPDPNYAPHAAARLLAVA